MSVLKATSLIKSRQATIVLREGHVCPRIARFFQTSIGHYNIADINYFNYSYNDGSLLSSRNTGSMALVPLNANQIAKKSYRDGPGVPPQSPTSEGLDSTFSGTFHRSELITFDLPSIHHAGKSIVNQWNDSSALEAPIHSWQQFYFNHGVTGIPKSNKSNPFPDEDKFQLSKGFGEDAFFIRQDSLGVADGVGGWKKFKGANSAFFSRNLMHFACKELSELDALSFKATQTAAELNSRYFPPNENIHYAQVDPVKILEASYRLATKSASVYKIKGSSTACIVILRNKELRIANLGDCGVVVLRNGSIVFQTSEQQHSFNFPYQLGTNSKDRPTDAQSYSVPVQRGDVIVMGSDGLFDNLFGSDIEDEVAKWSPSLLSQGACSFRFPDEILSLSTGSTTLKDPSLTFTQTKLDPGKLSHALASRACHVSHQTSSTQATPFKERATREGLTFKGGKRDDITVLVAIVTPLSTADGH